mgnify:CR=1 FL=1|tara:strand:- start:376 stop:606 length:231 start_codon:yes stop_codon:yes gene_type:complete
MEIIRLLDKITKEEIAAHYKAMGESVTLINGSKPDKIFTNDEWNLIVEKNKEHLRLMVAKDYWTDEDMTAVNAAIG